MNDAEYMSMALELAKKGCGYVNPNPMVGAVIVKDGTVIGKGYHAKYGELHAERNALADCSVSPKGATIYVTLEPCCHYGKTPPCTEAIIENGITKVVVGSKDPNPLVAGKGIEILRKHNIEVVEGILEEECNKLNEVFFHFIQSKTPFIAMKYAMTLDGKIATCTGESKWITGETARAHVHTLRHHYAGIMVGVETVIADDPMLSCRIEGGRNPVRIICDTRLRTPLEANILKTAHHITTYIATACKDLEKHAPFIEAGCKILVVSKKEEHIDLAELMEKLGQEKIDSILLEGGATLNFSFLKSGLINKVYTYIAPKLVGGKLAKTPIEGVGISELKDAILLGKQQITPLGEDLLIESEVTKNVHRYH